MSNALTGEILEREATGPPPSIKKRDTAFPQAKKLTIKKKNQNPPKQMSMFDIAEEMTHHEMEEEDQNNEDANKPKIDNSPMDSNVVRFDFNGHEITSDNLTEEQLYQTDLQGLHHHGDFSEKPGYAIYELAVMCRSRNVGQRGFAFEFLAKILTENPGKYISEIKSVQLPRLSLFALQPPTTKTISFNAGTILLHYMISYPNSFSIRPYPAVPPATQLISEFSEYGPAFVAAALEDQRLLPLVALLTNFKPFDISSLSQLPPSIGLFQVGISAYIKWFQKHFQSQAYTVISNHQRLFSSLTSNKKIQNDEIELGEEAATLLIYTEEIEALEKIDIKNLHPNIQAIFLSRMDSIKQCQKYSSFIPQMISLCPDPFALSFISNCSRFNLITPQQALDSISNSPFSPSVVQLSLFSEFSSYFSTKIKGDQKFALSEDSEKVENSEHSENSDISKSQKEEKKTVTFNINSSENNQINVNLKINSVNKNLLKTLNEDKVLIEPKKTKSLIPKMPTIAEDCWPKRAEICGLVEYILSTQDYQYLPDVIPCLYSFTDPSADILIKKVFNFNAPKERPITIDDLFIHLETDSLDKIPKLLSISIYFPIRYMCHIFSRKDWDKKEIDDILNTFLDQMDNSKLEIPRDSLRSVDVADFFSKLEFDCFHYRSFQRFTYLCISGAASPEVRHSFWDSHYQLARKFDVTCSRNDVHKFIEDDRSCIESILNTLKANKYSNSPMLQLAAELSANFLNAHHGEFIGEVMYNKLREMDPQWEKLILSQLHF